MEPFFLFLAIVGGVLTSVGLRLWQAHRFANKQARWREEEQERIDDVKSTITQLGGRDG